MSKREPAAALGTGMVEKTRHEAMVALSRKAMVSMAFDFSSIAQEVDSIDKLDLEMAGRLSEISIPNFILYQVADRSGKPTAALKCGRSNPEWRDYYMANTLAPRDEVLMTGVDSREHFTWGQCRLKPGQVTRDKNFIFDEARRFDYVDGFYMPMHQKDQTTYAISMMATRRLPVDNWMNQSLFLMAHSYTLGVLRINREGATLQLPYRASDANAKLLTPRQRECLTWVRAGKTDWEISQILGLSQHTVIEYLEDARRRLNVRTRTQAVIEAVNRGIISL